MNQAYELTRERVLEREGVFIRRVYNWMLAGLAVTGGIAYFTGQSEAYKALILSSTWIFYLLLGAELVMVFVLAGRVERMSSGTAGVMFIIYSLLNGLTLATIFWAYTQKSIAVAFFVTAGTFGVMSFIGYTTKRSLASLGGFLMMGLVGIIIASVVNFFIHSQMILWLVTYLGVLIFVGLTAYDTQRLRQMARAGFGSEEVESRAAVMGALALYLDFINLFLMILRIFGGSRD